MLGLPEEYFDKLRLHTYHLTNDSSVWYEFSAQEFVTKTGVQELTRGIPRDLVLYEPPLGIGCRLDDGRLMSYDSVRYQKTVNTLYRQGILDALRTPARRSTILEIGGGYGGLAHHLSRILGNTTYIIVDLPEVLLFSASFLTMLNGTKKIYLYNQADFSSFIDSSDARSYDFIFIPNYCLEALRGWNFDLVLNMHSFQEMSEDQVTAYLDFIRDTCTGVLYSLNKDRHNFNPELASLTALLRPRFALNTVDPSAPYQSTSVSVEVSAGFRSMARVLLLSLGLLNHLRRWRVKRWTREHGFGLSEYICTPLQPSTPAQAGTHTKR
jgi:SAM-dependent methyltransferase